MLLLLTIAVTTQQAIGQPRGRGGTPRDIGRPGEKDPTDDAERNAKLQAKAQKIYAEGEAALAKDRIPYAKMKFRSVVELVGVSGVGESALSALKQIQARGQEALNDARSLYEKKDYVLAIEKARFVQRNYANILGGLSVGGDAPNLATLAVDLIKQIESDPAAKPTLQEEQARPLAKRIERFEKQARTDKSRLLDVYDTCRKLASKFPDCPTAKTCVARSETLRKDKKNWSIISRERDRRDVLSQLGKIEELEKAGEDAAARKALDRLLIKHPGKTRQDLERLSRTKVE
ncbi:MAG: hypothetical protein KF841_06970 [Phycisphaerae bacterium]|nr:hypothetical protein [Phycisphaerae bacterium]